MTKKPPIPSLRARILHLFFRSKPLLPQEAHQEVYDFDDDLDICRDGDTEDSLLDETLEGLQDQEPVLGRPIESPYMKDDALLEASRDENPEKDPFASCSDWTSLDQTSDPDLLTAFRPKPFLLAESQPWHTPHPETESSSHFLERDSASDLLVIITDAIASLRALHEKVSHLPNTTNMRTAYQAVIQGVAHLETVVNGLAGEDFPTSECQKAAWGVTLINARYYEDQARRARDEFTQLQQRTNQWRHEVWVSRAAHTFTLHIAEMALTMVYAAIEADPRLDESLTSITLTSPATRALQKNGVTTLRDLARLSTTELMALPNIGPKTLSRIAQYFGDANLPALCRFGKVHDWFYEGSYEGRGCFGLRRTYVDHKYQWTVPGVLWRRNDGVVNTLACDPTTDSAWVQQAPRVSPKIV